MGELDYFEEYLNRPHRVDGREVIFTFENQYAAKCALLNLRYISEEIKNCLGYIYDLEATVKSLRKEADDLYEEVDDKEDRIEYFKNEIKRLNELLRTEESSKNG